MEDALAQSLAETERAIKLAMRDGAPPGDVGRTISQWRRDWQTRLKAAGGDASLSKQLEQAYSWLRHVMETRDTLIFPTAPVEPTRHAPPVMGSKIPVPPPVTPLPKPARQPSKPDPTPVATRKDIRGPVLDWPEPAPDHLEDGVYGAFHGNGGLRLLLRVQANRVVARLELERRRYAGRYDEPSWAQVYYANGEMEDFEPRDEDSPRYRAKLSFPQWVHQRIARLTRPPAQ